jgi:Tol biopolymer transport system component
MAQRFDPAREALEGEATLVIDSVRLSSGVTGFAVSEAGLLVFQPDPGYGSRVWLDRRGAALDSVSSDEAWTFRISHDGGRVAQGGFGLWVRDLRRGVAIKLPTPGSEIQPEPVWSPDDARIAYKAWARAGRYQGVHITRVDGSGEDVPLPLPPGAANARPLDWSANGRLILVATDATAEAPRPALWLGDVKTHVMTRWQTVSGSIPYARFSPDGRWIAYQSNETGAPEVYLRQFPGPGAAVRVSPSGGGRPAWRADGRELFYLTPAGDLMGAPVAPRGLPEVGPARRIAPRITNEPYQESTPYDLTPDGKRILVGVETRVRPPLALLAPWTLTLPVVPR